jgi:enterochelin esterase-like enzyme
MKKFLLGCFWLASFLKTSAQTEQALPNVEFGKIERIEACRSKFVLPRHIDVWLPPGYTPEEKFPVIYFHDGQMLFDSSLTFNKKSWFLDKSIGKAMAEGRMKKAIIVAIWNTGNQRYGDYFPQKPFENLPDSGKQKVWVLGEKFAHRKLKNQKPNSDDYLRFLVEELKPLIDKKYSTLSKPENTMLAGSSMGGLISMYAICEYPKVFGSAFCFSTHWPGIFTEKSQPIPQTILAYFSKKLPKPGKHFFYFDHGTATLDSLYAPHQQVANQILLSKGYRPDIYFVSRVFPGENHSEDAWAKRVEPAFFWRLGKKR